MLNRNLSTTINNRQIQSRRTLDYSNKYSIDLHKFNRYCMPNINEIKTEQIPTLDNPQTWLGLSRVECRQQLAQHHLKSIAFAQWLSIPTLRLLLTFQHQQCVAIETLAVIS